MNDGPVISINKLSKRYNAGSPYALKNLTLSINKGEVFGFLGPNGAGKSTAIRTLLNFIQPTGGSATILGLDIVKDSVKIRRNLGYLSGDFKAYEKMTGKQLIKYMNSLQPPKRKGFADELAHTFKANLNKRISELSKGNRQKLGVIQAFMHEPEVIVLDEPTDGLDPLVQESFYELLKQVAGNGTTIFMSSHNLGEVKKVCDRVAIIKDGLLVSEKTIADLAKEAAQTLIVTFEGPAPINELKKLKDTKVTKNKDGTAKLHIHGPLPPVLALLAKHNATHIVSQEFNLEDEFMKFYETKAVR